MNEIDNDDWYDFENDRPLFRPPVGARILFEPTSGYRQIMWVVAHHKTNLKAFIMCDNISLGELLWGSIGHATSKYFPEDYPQKMQERNKLADMKEKFIEDYLECRTSTLGLIAEDMIKLGWRKGNSI